MNAAHQTTLDRYLEKIAASNEDGCREWLGTPNKDGYGQFSVAPKRSFAAHRWGYEQFIGPIPKGKVVQWTCSNTLCQEPTHWYLVDKEGRTTSYAGGKLTPDEVRAIRRKHAEGKSSYRALAREFGVQDYHTIYNVVKRKTWKHVK